MPQLLRTRSTGTPHRPAPMRSATELTEPLMSQQNGASLGAYETRQRTQLVVEGFSNLALLAILFSGVQAQFISSTSGDNNNAVAIATNAAMFGGLILSVCSALLATLSGRWFSILREDDSEFLSSQWLAAEARQKPTPIIDYLKFQRDSWSGKLPSQFQLPSSPVDTFRRQSDTAWSQTVTGSPAQEMAMLDLEAGKLRPSLNPRERDVQFVVEMIEREIEGKTTLREKLIAKVLLSAVGICCAAFALFALGIELLVWNTQPISVAVFTSILLGLNLILMPGFFLKHRHKRVISELALERAAL